MATPETTKRTNVRSFLFVPADSERKLARSADSLADVLILDLEDAVAESRKLVARTMAQEFLTTRAVKLAARVYVRINPFDTALALDDLAAVVVPGLDGILLPKIQGASDLVRLGHCLDVLEARAGMTRGSVQMMPVATETPQAMLSMQGFAGSVAMPRLAGVTWGAEDIAAAVGALSNRDAGGQYSPLYDLAGSLCLLAAAAANVPAIETMYGDFRDSAGLTIACAASRRRGFRGRIAIHPDQVDVINAAYSPTAEERARAQRIVDAFAREPDAGTLGIDGTMVDKPHLAQARRTLGLPS